ncbi:MAG: hypothetical protein JWN40_746 [Phycisphaerales bacterium]|nr:hypothetical protein [Phycisphaerales bacterium]
MTPDNALRLASWVEGLFGETTPQQVAFLADQFAPFDVAVVESEVTRFRRHFDVLNIANLLRRITDEQQKRTARTSAAARSDRRKVDAQWERDDAAVARLSDDELHRHKEAILTDQPSLRKFLADKDPRQSVMLRSLILDKRIKKRAD